MATVSVNKQHAARYMREGLMCVITGCIEFSSRGDADIVRITDEVAEAITQAGLRDGTVTVFAPGATGAITTIEYEPGVVQDLQERPRPDRAAATAAGSTTSTTATATVTRTCAPACSGPR